MTRLGLLAASRQPLGELIATMNPSYSTSTGLTVVSANRACAYRLALGGSGPITKVGLQVGTASGNICIQHWRNTGSGRSALPGTRIATTGSVACPAAGYREVDLVTEVLPDDWLVIQADNTTATFAGLLATPLVAGLANGAQCYSDSGFPLGTTPTWSQGTNRTICLIGVP